MAVAGSGRTEDGRFKRSIAWFLFVFFIPIVFALLLVGFALQIVGVPVLKTVEHHLGLTKPVVTKSAGPTADQRLRLADGKYQSLQATTTQLRVQLDDSRRKVTALEQRVTALDGRLHAVVTTAAAAKSEGQILVAMDASQAALVLARMPLTDAARVVAAMSASDSGPILAAMDPKVAAPIIQAAAKIAH